MDHDFGSSALPGQDERINQQNLNNNGGSTTAQCVAEERPTVSVMIDEDEDEDAAIIHHADIEESSEKVYPQDHDYVSGRAPDSSPAQPFAAQKSKFPILEGLDFQDAEEYRNVAAPVLKVQQQAQRQSVRRLTGFRKQEDFMPPPGFGANPHYRQQMKDAQQQRYSQMQQQQFHSPIYQQQYVQKRTSQLAPNLRPAVRRLPPSMMSSEGQYLLGRASGGAHSQPPPYQRAQFNESAYLPMESGLPAPIVTTARGRPPGSRNKPMGTEYTKFNEQRSPMRSYGGHTTMPPSSTDVYGQKKITPSPIKQQQYKSGHAATARITTQERERPASFSEHVDEEELENEKFLRSQKMPPALGRGRRQRKPRVSGGGAEQSESAKTAAAVPDDPMPVSYQTSPTNGNVQMQQPQYESSLDSTIAAVIRGEASVLQQFDQQAQHFGTSPPQPPTHVGQQPPFYGRQSPTKPVHQSPQRQQQRAGGRGDRFDMSPKMSRLDDLADLAQASSMLHQNAKPVMRTPVYHQQSQQQQQAQHYPQEFQPSQQTLHFKVVATNNASNEPLPQDYRQQVFTVQQQASGQFEARSPQLEQEQADQQMHGTEKKSRTRRISKRQMAELEMQTGNILSTSMSPAEQQKIPGKAKRGRPSKREIEARNLLLGKRTTAKKMMANGVKTGGAFKRKPVQLKLKRNTAKKETNSWGEDYVTRCLCGLKNNDPFMIQCDRCDVWQHGVCMGVSSRKVPDKYFCEQCEPRELKLSAEQAAKIQKANIKRAKGLKMAKSGAASKISRAQIRSRIAVRSAKFQKRIKKADDFAVKDVARNAPKQAKREFEATTENQYSREVKALTAGQPNFSVGSMTLLKKLKSNSLTRQMYVAPNLEGLVATPGPNSVVTSGTPLVEYNGVVSLLSEVRSRTPNKLKRHDFTLVYSGFGVDTPLHIDATKIGSIARFARRSCRPNSTVQHAIFDGQIHFYLYATSEIDNSTEVTIPFDFNYEDSKIPLECACGTNNLYVAAEDRCPIQEFNRMLGEPKEAAPLAAPLLQPRIASPNLSQSKSPSPQKRVTRSARVEDPPINETGGTGDALSKRDEQPEQQKGRRLRSQLDKPIGVTIPKPENVSPSDEPRKSLDGRDAKKSSTVQKTPKSEVVGDDVGGAPSSSSTGRRNIGLPALLSASRRRQSAAPTANAPPPAKRGRPSGSGTAAAKLANATPKQEPAAPKEESSSPQKMSREERKMQAAIALVDSMERGKLKKQHEATKTEVKASISAKESPPKKARVEGGAAKKSQQQGTTPVAKKVDRPISEEDLWGELSSIVRTNVGGNARDFVLPAEYAVPPPDSPKEPKTKKAKESASSSAAISAKPANIVPIKVLQSKEKKKEEVAQPVRKEAKKEQVESPAAAPKAQKSAECEPKTTAEAEPSSTVARPPNTKAMKKITIDEYKRKRMAEAQQAQRPNVAPAGGSASTQPSAGQSPVPFRQSPRKSFIPNISAIDNRTPQQLEDFPGASSSGSRHQQPPPQKSPTIEELKKRILGAETSTSTSSSSAAATRDVPSRVAAQQQKPQQQRMSIEDRLKLMRFGKKQ